MNDIVPESDLYGDIILRMFEQRKIVCIWPEPLLQPEVGSFYLSFISHLEAGAS